MRRAIIVYLVFLHAQSVFCEDMFGDPDLEPEYTIQTNEEAILENQSNGTEGEKLKGLLTTDRPEYDQANDSKGREYKAESAEKDSGTGKAVAAATGAAMIATGSSMVPSPILAVRIAGINLIIKGTIELAQAGADGGAESKNEGQKNMLLDAAGDLGDKLEANKQEGGLSNDAKNALTGLGIEDPEAFAKQAAAGAYDDPRAAMEALGLGDPSQITDADIATAKDIEVAELKDVFADQHGKVAAEKLTVDESQKDKLSASGSSASGLSIRDGAGTSSGSSNLGGSSFAGGSTAEGGSSLSSLAPSKEAGSTTTGSIGGMDLGNRGAGGGATDPLATISRNRLLELGIRKKQIGQNIFTIARYHYRRYDGWRHNKSKKAGSVTAMK